MSKVSMNFRVKDMYAIKHSLQRNIEFKEKALKGNLDKATRNMYENDIVHEIILLAEVTERINLQINGHENCNGVRVMNQEYAEANKATLISRSPGFEPCVTIFNQPIDIVPMLEHEHQCEPIDNSYDVECSICGIKAKRAVAYLDQD